VVEYAVGKGLKMVAVDDGIDNQFAGVDLAKRRVGVYNN
jgi:putative ubiquitin-RnfH superfamily antitoxin RatB of RatAB toxin-antitoxin module